MGMVGKGISIQISIGLKWQMRREEKSLQQPSIGSPSKHVVEESLPIQDGNGVMYIDKCKYGNNNGIGMGIFNFTPGSRPKLSLLNTSMFSINIKTAKGHNATLF